MTKTEPKADENGVYQITTETDIVTEHGIQASFSLVDLICKPCQLITAGDLVNSVFIGLRLCLCHTIPV